MLMKYSEDLPSLFDNIFNTNFLSEYDSNVSSIKVDVAETDDNVEVIADIPGFKKDEIKIEYNKGYITLSGEVKKEEEKKNVKFLYKEIGNRSFRRSFYVGDSFDISKIEAIFKDGVLKVILPKNEKEKFKEIEIH